jgi:hypothetical protein
MVYVIGAPFEFTYSILKPRSKGFFKNLSVKLEAGKVCVILSLSAKGDSESLAC